MVNSSASSKPARDKFLDYKSRSDLYFENARKFESERPTKASEFYWGAVTQAIKAIALLRGTRIWEHKQYGEFVKEFSKEVNNPKILRLFANMHALHKNFYEGDLDSAYYELYVTDAIELLMILEKYYK